MSNDTRIRIFDWYASAPVRGGVLVCFGTGLGLSPLAAFADAGLPPPAVHQQTDNGFPSSQALKNQGYDPQSGKITVNKTGSPKVSSSGGKITGTQNVRIDTVDKYGNRGAINSSVSQTVNSGALARITAGLYAASALGGAMNSPFMNNAISDIKSGDYSSAAKNGFGAALEGLSKLDVTGIGGGINNVLNEIFKEPSNSQQNQSESLNKAAAAAKSAQSKAMNDGNAAGAITAAAAAKAATAAMDVMKKNEQLKQPSDGSYKALVTFVEQAPDKKIVTQQIYDAYVPNISGGNNGSRDRGGSMTIDIYAPRIVGDYVRYTFQNPESRFVSVSWSSKADLKPEDVVLTESEIAKILEQMLNNQQTNHKELMEQLSKINAGTTTINNTENNTTINNGGNRPKGNSVVDKATENVTNKGGSTRSAPYTPAGSNEAQQTEWTLNPDGSVTTNIIPRPDLKPNSSQAPTRSEVYGNNQSQNGNQAGQNQQGNQPSQNQQQQQQNFCKENPNSAACAELGDSSYEDLLIPENPVDLELKPLDIFSTDGVCPANPTFTFGALGTMEIDYQYFCRIARLLRPILILGTMIMCGFVAYNAVKEL